MVHKVSLIPDWKHAWKYASVHFQAAGVLLMAGAEILGETWKGLPPALQQKMPHATTIALVLFGLGLIGRILKKNDSEDHGDQ
jgi:hypothetical protein